MAHEDRERRPRYLLQFFPRIGAVQVAVSDQYPGTITCGSGYLSFREAGGEKAEKRDPLCQWAEPELHIPSYLDPRLIPGEALHVRFRTKPQGRVGRGGETCKLGELSDVLKNSKIPEYDALVIRCGFCYNTVTKDGNFFQRILPLPSDHWNEFMGNAFCHNHGDHAQPSSFRLQPRDTDCLVGDSILLLRSSTLDFDRGALLRQNAEAGASEETVISCKRCHHRLGKAEPSDSPARTLEGDTCCQMQSTDPPTPNSFVVQFQRSWVILGDRMDHEKGRLLNREMSVTRWLISEENRLARKLYSSSKERMSFQFIVEDERTKPYLYLCVPNAVSRVMWNSHPNSHPTGTDSTLTKFSGLSRPFSSPPPNVCDCPVLKVLFKVGMAMGSDSREQRCGEGTSPLSQWYKDSTVDVLQWTADECLWLVLFLMESSMAFPPSLRSANGLTVGFLRLPIGTPTS